MRGSKIGATFSGDWVKTMERLNGQFGDNVRMKVIYGGAPVLMFALGGELIIKFTVALKIYEGLLIMSS